MRVDTAELWRVENSQWQPQSVGDHDRSIDLQRAEVVLIRAQLERLRHANRELVLFSQHLNRTRSSLATSARTAWRLTVDTIDTVAGIDQLMYMQGYLPAVLTRGYLD